MLNLQNITNNDVVDTLIHYIAIAEEGSDSWRILSAALTLSAHFSFTDTMTYPRPDHPDPEKRRPLIFMLVAILVSLRTTLENEQKAVHNILQRYPSQEELFSAEVSELELCIKPAGMSEKRSRTIRRALDYIKDELNGSLEALDSYSMEESRRILLQIPGVGPKAADCLLSIGLGKPSIAVDVNVFRVASWLLMMPWANNPDYNNENQVKEVKYRLDRALPNDAFLLQIVHTLFLLYGKSIGAKHPNDGSCLVKNYCKYCEECIISEQLKLDLSD